MLVLDNRRTLLKKCRDVEERQLVRGTLEEQVEVFLY